MDENPYKAPQEPGTEWDNQIVLTRLFWLCAIAPLGFEVSHLMRWIGYRSFLLAALASWCLVGLVAWFLQDRWWTGRRVLKLLAIFAVTIGINVWRRW